MMEASHTSATQSHTETIDGWVIRLGTDKLWFAQVEGEGLFIRADKYGVHVLNYGDGRGDFEAHWAVVDRLRELNASVLVEPW